MSADPFFGGGPSDASNTDAEPKLGRCDLDRQSHPENDGCSNWIEDDPPGTLRYRRAPMTLNMTQYLNGQSYRISLEGLRKDLLDRKMIAYHLFLEPGDATRYEFVLVPIWSGSRQRGLLVTYLTSRKPVSSYVLWDWDKWASGFHIDEAARQFGVGNEWTVRIVRWFLGHVCDEFSRKPFAR